MTPGNLISGIFVLVLVANNTAIAELLPNGNLDDENISIVYNAQTGEIGVDTGGRFIGQINVRSESEIFFTGPRPEAMFNCLCFLTERSIYKERSEFMSESYGPLLPKGLTEPFLLQDLTVFGRGPILRPTEFGPEVDLVYIPVPEPSATFILFLATLTLGATRAPNSFPSGWRDA